MNSNYSALFFLYGLLSIIILSVTTFCYANERKFTGIFIVRMMFFIVYGLVPIATLLSLDNPVIRYKLRALDLSRNGLHYLTLMAFFSLIGYLSLEAGYAGLFRRRQRGRYTPPPKAVLFAEQAFPYAGLHIAAWIMVTISAAALLMWSSPFGGIAGIMEYGRVIRSGETVRGVSNSFGFMKHFVPLSMFASLLFLGLWRREGTSRNAVGFAAALTISVIYAIGNDGRAPFTMYLVSIMVLWNIAKPTEKRKTNPFLYAIAIFSGFLLITNMDNLFVWMRTGTYGTEQADTGFFTFLADEFSFTFRNAQSSQEALASGETFRVGKDLLSAVFALVPSRLTPSGVVRLEKVNTLYWMGTYRYYGGKPTDIMAAGLYELWYFGIVCWPFLYGVIIRKVDGYIERLQSTLYGSILFVQLIYQFAKTVAYCDLALITLNLFYIVLGHIIVRMVCTLSEKNSERFRLNHGGESGAEKK